MDLIKDKQNAVLLLNTVLNEYGTGKEIAQMIDNLIFECLFGWCKNGHSLGTYYENVISTAKEVRDMFYNIE